MSFLISFYRSLGNLDWLKRQKQATKAAWKYFLLLIVLLTIVSTVPFVVSFPSAARELKDKVMSNVPDFQASLKLGKLAVTGFSQPFIYRDKDSGFVFVVDTVSTSSIGLANYLKEDADSGMRIGQDGMEMIDGLRGETKSQTWKNFPDYTVSKVELIQKIAKYSSAGMIALIIVGTILLSFVGITLSKLWSLLLVSLIVYFVSAIARRGWKWGELFVVGLYATTLPSVIAIVFMLFGVGVSFVHFLALLAFMLAVVLTMDERTIEDVVSSEE